MNGVAFDSETHLLSIEVIFWGSAGAVRSVQQQFFEPACAGPMRVLRGVFGRSVLAAGGARWASPPLRAGQPPPLPATVCLQRGRLAAPRGGVKRGEATWRCQGCVAKLYSPVRLFKAVKTGCKSQTSGRLLFAP